ncbi:MAG: DNA mismatch repair endonuclease MutL [Longimicrobiaceae bacterium]
MSSSRRIHILPDALVNQIAAGEVVERPASVVRELVENSLDAGATRIDVALRGGGKAEIRVADDGCGMGREDALLALDRHATSKLASVDDLGRIRSLGFRGEALPSIGSVSRLSLETAEGKGEGTRVTVAAGRVTGVEPIARAPGTTLVVRGLFHNLPVRAKFLRSAAAETRAAVEAVSARAIGAAGVTFRVESNGRVLLDTGDGTGLPRRLAALWGDEAVAELVPVSHRDGGAEVCGFVQRPREATPGPRRSYLFVNGRVFADRLLVRAIDRGFATTVAPGVRPSHVLFLRLPDGEVDVNVHPAKAEVRFRDRARIERLVEEGVRAALATAASAPSLGRSGSVGGYGTPASGNAAVRERLGDSERESQMALFVAPVTASDADRAEAPELPPARPPQIWQLHRTYLAAETRRGLILIDQHSAHERVMYEQVMRDFESGAATGQRLLFPLTLRLTAAECALAEEIAPILGRGGWEVEPFGADTVIVHATPQPHAGFDAEHCLREMLAELVGGSPLVDPARTRHQKVALTFACKAAIKAGQTLSPEEMRELFDRLWATELPYHDIHGRPTVVELELEEIHRRFRRSPAR